MEGAEFVTDEDNLAAWHRRFRQHHCWAVDVGPATFIGLSTTRFRRWGWTWAGAMPGGSPPNMPTPGSITVQRCVRRTTHSLCKAVPPDPHPSLPPRVPACCRCPSLPPSLRAERSNPFSAHEVHVDDEQLAFFRGALAAAGGRPVVVFTHAPILGSGLKVVQAVHVKNRCGAGGAGPSH